MQNILSLSKCCANCSFYNIHCKAVSVRNADSKQFTETPSPVTVTDVHR